MIDLTYINDGGVPGGDAGDPYGGWDRFGRTQDMRWLKGGSAIERVLYGAIRSTGPGILV